MGPEGVVGVVFNRFSCGGLLFFWRSLSKNPGLWNVIQDFLKG